MAAEHGVDLSQVTPTGKGGKVTKDDIQSVLAPIASSATGDVIATPAARRTARLKSVDLSLVRGSGPRR